MTRREYYARTVYHGPLQIQNQSQIIAEEAHNGWILETVAGAWGSSFNYLFYRDVEVDELAEARASNEALTKSLDQTRAALTIAETTLAQHVANVTGLKGLCNTLDGQLCVSRTERVSLEKQLKSGEAKYDLLWARANSFYDIAVKTLLFDTVVATAAAALKKQMEKSFS